MNIISASRRTDIPAFYGEWFMNRIKEKKAYVLNPYNNKTYDVSLDQNDVLCFVFWSKNYIPFTNRLIELNDLGYRFYFNYTITGLPKEFECNIVETDLAVENMIKLSKLFSPKHVNWRYDPIIISNKTDYDYHKKEFERLANILGSNGIEKCYFSFMTPYAKIKPHIQELEKTTDIKISVLDVNTKPFQDKLYIDLAETLAITANKYGMQMYSCGEYPAKDLIKKAHCIDSTVISALFGSHYELKENPTRLGCGCFDSIDIGAYDTCPHGCMYCYANVNKEIAKTNNSNHDPNTKILGKSVKESLELIDKVKIVNSLF